MKFCLRKKTRHLYSKLSNVYIHKWEADKLQCKMAISERALQKKKLPNWCSIAYFYSISYFQEQIKTNTKKYFALQSLKHHGSGSKPPYYEGRIFTSSVFLSKSIPFIGRMQHYSNFLYLNTLDSSLQFQNLMEFNIVVLPQNWDKANACVIKISCNTK